MVEVLKLDKRLWAVDKLILAYFAFMAVLIVAWWSDVPYAPRLLAWHAILTALLFFEIKRPNRTTWLFRNWYPVIYVASCYKEMADYLPIARHINFDQPLADLDGRIWGIQPAVWFARNQNGFITEYLQVVYTLFVPAVILVAVLLWRRRLFAEFQYYAFVIALGYLASYVGYVLVPARGPRFLLQELQGMPLHGSWLFHGMQALLDQLEAVAFDCFPSGHTELTVLAWWGSRAVSKGWFTLYFVYTPSIIFATVYLRYHYTIDIFAGALLAVILIAVSPSLYRKMQAEV